MNPNPFSAQSKGISVAVTTTSGSSSSAALPTAGNSIRVVNAGPNDAFISVGSGAQTATAPTTGAGVATCTAVLAGEDTIFGIPNSATLTIAAITATGTATLYVYVGEGV